MDSTQPNPRPRRRATTQTIEQIEARGVAIIQAEQDAMNRLAGFLRELAVELPVESKLPVRFAQAANSIEVYTSGDGAISSSGVWRAQEAIDEWRKES